MLRIRVESIVSISSHSIESAPSVVGGPWDGRRSVGKLHDTQFFGWLSVERQRMELQHPHLFFGLD